MRNVLEYYDATFKMRQTGPDSDNQIDIWSFTSKKTNKRYIVEVEYFDYHFYGINVTFPLLVLWRLRIWTIRKGKKIKDLDSITDSCYQCLGPPPFYRPMIKLIPFIS